MDGLKWLFWLNFCPMRQFRHVEQVSLTVLWLQLPRNIKALENVAWILLWEKGKMSFHCYGFLHLI